jgi:hypothetical protein
LSSREKTACPVGSVDGRLAVVERAVDGDAGIVRVNPPATAVARFRSKR